MTKIAYTLLFYISFLCCFQGLFAQEEELEKTEKPKTEKTEKLKPSNSYGLRIGADIYKLVRTATSKQYNGFEIGADYRITRKWYAAAEIGNENFATEQLSLSTTSKGSYIRLGGDYNVFKNLVGMRNLIYVGGRYGFSTFSQDLDNFTLATTNSFFEIKEQKSDLSSSGLTAHWIEMTLGLKAEVLNNVFLGFAVAVKRTVSSQKPEGFDNLFIPGFGKTNEFSEFGVGFSYYISYYIPLYKIKHKPKKKEEEEEEEKEGTEVEIEKKKKKP